MFVTLSVIKHFNQSLSFADAFFLLLILINKDFRIFFTEIELLALLSV